MEKTVSPVRLGQRVYGVTNIGEIIPTLISQIEIPELALINRSEIVQRSRRRLRGPEHETDTSVIFHVLDHSIQKTWFTFDEAYEVALEVVTELATSEDLTVREQRTAKARRKYLLKNKEEERAKVDGVDHFSASRTIVDLIVSADNGDNIYTVADFPTTYFDVGTVVWIADLRDWQIIHGYVNEVHFAPSWKDHIVYYCGSHTNLETSLVFITKEEALDYLAEQFSAKLPGTLDKDRVEVVKQVSKAERNQKMYDRIHAAAQRMRPAGEPAN